MTAARPRRAKTAGSPDRFQTASDGDGTLHTTAISTVAITAVIFSLAARFMASSEFSAAALYAPSCGYPVTEITLRPPGLLSPTLLLALARRIFPGRNFSVGAVNVLVGFRRRRGPSEAQLY
jgi:hypothetical protein